MKSDSKFYGFGRNAVDSFFFFFYPFFNLQYGQLGDGTKTNRYTPQEATLFPNYEEIEDISPGFDFTLILRKNGSVSGIGANFVKKKKILIFFHRKVNLEMELKQIEIILYLPHLQLIKA